MILRFLIPGSIQAWGRHGTVAMKHCSVCGKNTVAHTCKCGNTNLSFMFNAKVAHGPTEKYESFVSLCAVQAGVQQKTYTGAVELRMIFRFAAPDSRRKGKHAVREGDPHVSNRRNDLDNCIKSVLDGLNRVAWYDDGQVSRIWADKVWTLGEPGVEVSIDYLDIADALPLTVSSTGAEGVNGMIQTRSPFQKGTL